MKARQGSVGTESWNALFDFLDPNRSTATGPDRDREAENKCAEVIRKLVCFFASRRCANPEDLAMETVLRVASKCREVDVSSYTERIGYFYGIARNVVHEAHRSGLRESRARESFAQEGPAFSRVAGETAGSGPTSLELRSSTSASSRSPRRTCCIGYR